MNNEYVAKHESAIPGKVHTSRQLFYTIVKHITGGGKQQEARARVDFISTGVGQPQTGGSIDTKQKKARVSFEDLDLARTFPYG